MLGQDRNFTLQTKDGRVTERRAAQAVTQSFTFHAE